LAYRSADALCDALRQAFLRGVAVTIATSRTWAKEGPIPMRKVARLVYAGFETPNLDTQIEYYTRIIGLRLVERAADAVFLSATGIDHHTVALRKSPRAKCAGLGMLLSGDIGLERLSSELSLAPRELPDRSRPMHSLPSSACCP
jgi:hypothetical protein